MRAAASSTAWFTRNGARLAYDDEGGDPRAPAVVFLHAASDDREAWETVRDALVDRFRVIRIDLRGHGDSDRASGPYRIPDYGDDVTALCDAVVGGPVVLVGHSLGAVTAAYVAAVRPDLVSAAFLEDPPMYLFEPDTWNASVFSTMFPAVQAAIRSAQAEEDPEARLREFLAAVPSARGGTMAEVLGPEGTARLARAWARFDPRMFDVAIDLTAWGDHDIDSPIGCPVVVLRADPRFGPAFLAEHEERFRRIAPQAEFVMAEGCSHVIHQVVPEWFSTQLERFLASLSDGR